MKKSFLFLVTICLFSFLTSGCSNSSTFGDFLHDETEMGKVKAEISKKLDGGKIYKAVHLTNSGAIKFQKQNPYSADTTEAFYFLPQQNSWRGPEEMKIATPDNNDNSIKPESVENQAWNIDDVDWQQIPSIVKKAELRAKEEHLKEVKVDSVLIDSKEIKIKLTAKNKDAIYITNSQGLLKNFIIR